MDLNFLFIENHKLVYTHEYVKYICRESTVFEDDQILNPHFFVDSSILFDLA